MKIDIYSHSSSFGGAESALYALIRLLIEKNDIRVFLPKLKGTFFDILCSADIATYQHSFIGCLPQAYRMIDSDLYEVGATSVADINSVKPDLVVANTITMPHVLLFARANGIPSLVYAHEYLTGDPDLSPNGCSSDYYLQQVENLANHVLAASKFVASQFDPERTSLLYPFDNSSVNAHSRATRSLKKFLNEKFASIRFTTRRIKIKKLLAIGGRSKRKNFGFSIDMHKSLQLKGVDQSLLLIGHEGTTTSELTKRIHRRKVKPSVTVLGEQSDPYRFANGQPINLISSIVEPFGLTIVESLARGIPVVASRCGGPQEILPEKLIYDIGNHDQCAKILEQVWGNYPEACVEAKKIYAAIVEKNHPVARFMTLSNAIRQTIALPMYRKSPDVFFAKYHNSVLTMDEVISSIGKIAQERSLGLSTVEIRELISQELKRPGAAIQRDIQYFRITPFSHSSAMDDLYREGIGLGIELAAHLDDVGKRRMMNFVLLTMLELQSKLSRPLKVLCLGDGLGLDSITLASNGFDVDYMDYEHSVMSECAKLNLMKAITKKEMSVRTVTRVDGRYDCVMCLEVIEHVPDPVSFMRFISDALNPEGRLFLSECFEGIEDRWQTHLYNNEKYSYSLLDVSEECFSLVDLNLDPISKPMVFRKKDSNYRLRNSLSGNVRQKYFQQTCNLYIKKFMD